MTLRAGNNTIRAVSEPKFSKREENSDAPTISAHGECAVGESGAKQLSRRQFGRNAAAAIAAATTLSAPGLLATSTAGAQTQTSKPKPAPPGQTKPEPLEGLTDEQTAEVDARLANILRKYGSRFTEDQKTHLRGILAQNERMMAPVRAFALQNGDAPSSVLRISFDGRSATHHEQEKDGR